MAGVERDVPQTGNQQGTTRWADRWELECFMAVLQFFGYSKSRAMREQKSAKCLQSGYTAGNKTNIYGVPSGPIDVGLIFPVFALDSSCNSTQGCDPMRALSLQLHIIGAQPLPYLTSGYRKGV